LQPGEQVLLGEKTFTFSAVINLEPDRGGDMFSIAPRLMMNRADVAATGLIQFGSRVSYRLLVAGEVQQVKAFQDWAKARLQRGERIEDVRDARPEIRAVLEKSRQFLGLSAMASVLLAAVAMALAALRFVERNQDGCALMRCLGASQNFIVRVNLLQLLVLGVLGGLVGCALGYLVQEALHHLLQSLLLESLPAPSLLPVAQGQLTGLVLLLGVAWPMLARLRKVPAMRILRSDLPTPSLARGLAFVPVLLAVCGLVLWTAQDMKLGWITLGGLGGFLLLSVLIGWVALRVLRVVGRTQIGAWRFGVSNLARHPAASIATVAGFSIGLTALLLLTLVRGDLLRSWQQTLPENAPNRFVISIQPDQITAIRSFFAAENMPAPELQPMVRGRLQAVNGKPLDVSRFDERARRLAEREFNLSWALQMQADNQLVAGRWWQPQESGKPLLSLEQGIAETLGLKVGDQLRYEIGGMPVEVQVVNLRKVDWDSMRANFFAITTPGVLEKFPASYISSFYLPPQREDVLNRFVRAFPNVTVIDVAAIMTQLKGMMDRMAQAVQLVFGFSLAAGVLVLYAALAATQDARAREYRLLRVLGARSKQIDRAVLTEFALIGLLAGLVATLGASVLAWALSRFALHLPYSFNPMLLLWGVGLAVGGIPLAAWLGMRRILDSPFKTA
jgi:putative ABC transport system permease protein